MTNYLGRIRMDEIIFEWIRGDDEVETLVFIEENGDPLDFTGCHFDCDIEPLNKKGDRIHLSTDNQGIIINGNEVSLIIAHEQTENVTWKEARFDLQQITPDGKIKTWCNGKVRLQHDITRRV